MGYTYIPTPYDLYLATQKSKKIKAKIVILNQNMQALQAIDGDVIDCTVTIDAASDIRRTLSLTIQFNPSYISDENNVFTNGKITIDNSIDLSIGIIDTKTNQISWYKQGVFLLNENSYTFNAATQTLTLNCCDLMAKFTGLRNGVIGKGWNYTIPKGENISDTLTTIISQLGGVKNYSIEQIGSYNDDEIFSYGADDAKKNESNFEVPYDLLFSSGSTIYDIITALKDLYPAWEMFFDIEGRFICQKQLLEEDTSAAIVDSTFLDKVLISETRNNNFSKVKNAVEVYGKDGLYYGYAEDRTSGSQYQIGAHPKILAVYKDGDYANVRSDVEAENWAEYLLYQNCRLYDSITIQTILIPFITEVNVKMIHRSRFDNTVHTYIVKKINHDFRNCVTSIEMVKWYSINCTAYQPSLSAPIISAESNLNSIAVNISNVQFATFYKVYINNKFYGKTSGNNFISEVPIDAFKNNKQITINVTSNCDGFKSSEYSNTVSLELDYFSSLAIRAEEYLLTRNNKKIRLH